METIYFIQRTTDNKLLIDQAKQWYTKRPEGAYKYRTRPAAQSCIDTFLQDVKKVHLVVEYQFIEETNTFI